MRMRRVWVAAALAALWAGCSDDDSSSSSSSASGGSASSTTRSSTCLKFQDAMCAFQADRCKLMSRPECDSTAQSLFCKADSIIQPCIDALASAACTGTTPTACLGVADAAPAQAMCSLFAEAYCGVAERCKIQDKASCLTQAKQTLHCDSAIGVAPSFLQCQAELAVASCPPAGQSFTLPTSCKGVIKVKSVGGEAGPGWHAEAAGSLSSWVE